MARPATITDGHVLVDRCTFVKEYEEQNLLEKSVKFACTILANWEDAQDIAHTVYLNILLRFHDDRSTVRVHQGIATYVLMSVRNACTDVFRKKKRAADVSIERFKGDYADLSSLAASSVRTGGYTSVDTSIVIAELLHNIPWIYLEPIYYADLLGYSAEEAATLMGITYPAYKSRLQRGRVMARQQFASSGLLLR